MIQLVDYALLAGQSYQDSIKLEGFDSHFISNRETGTQVHVLRSPFKQLIVFRGTEAKSFADLKTDLVMVKKNAGKSGMVHSGFEDAYYSVMPEIDALINRKVKTVFIGHSLGGALAIIACSYFGYFNCQAVTFGAPRVFDSVAAREYEQANIQRFENAGDPVPHVPLSFWGFRHVGEVSWIKNKALISNPDPLRQAWDCLFSWPSTKLKAHSIETYIQNLKELNA